MRMSRRSMAVVGVAAGLSAVGAVAAASIPDASNTIHACYLNTGGNLRVIDTAAPGAGCDGAGETALTWNQTGPQGPAGPKGDTGPAGAAGAKGDPGAGVVAYRTTPRQKRAFVDEPGNDFGENHLDTKLELPAGTYSVAAHWFVSSPGALCFLLLRNGSAPLAGSIYGELSNPATVQYESTFGVPETPRYSTTVEHGQASVVGSIPAGGYALVRCQGTTAAPLTATTAQQAVITALRVSSAVVADENGGTTAPGPPAQGVTVKAPLKGTTAISGGTQSQLLKIASQGVKAPTKQQRARTVLLSTSGASVPEIAATVGISPSQVRKVVSAFAKSGLAGIR